MKARTKITIILCFVLSVLLAVFTVGYTFAWFANYASIEISLYTEEDGGYFESGDGKTADTAYKITSYRHLYNLAWMQNLGMFSDGTYFALGNDIDMLTESGYCVIPPIGNDSKPFNGVFNGNGYTISNLVVSTDKTKLSNAIEESTAAYNFSLYVGLFGNTGTSSEIKNFILDNPIIEVASENTSYSSSGSAYCGLAIGYVANKASSIGVIGGYLCVNKSGYSTYNSILGKISDSVTTSVTGGTAGELGSGDLGYGTSTDIGALHNTLTGNTETTDGTTGDVKKSYALPFRSASETFYESAGLVTTDGSDGTADTTSVTLSSGSKTVDVARTQAASTNGNNIGYYVGSDMKTYNELGSGETVDKFYTTYYSTFYYPNNSSESYECGVDYSGTTYPAPSDDIKEYLAKYGNYFIRLTGSEIDATNEGGLVYVNSDYGRVGSYSGAVLLPRRCIWVAPVQAGTIKIVCVAVGGNMGLRVNKLIRSTPKNYSTYFTSYSQALEFNAVLLENKAYYFEISVTDDDVANGVEYAVTGGNKYKTYISYIDLGTAGGTTSTDTSGEYDSTYQVSAIDFIYKNVTISQTSFDFEIADGTFEDTGTRIYFTAVTTDGSAIVMGFARESDGLGSTSDPDSTSYTITVTYYISGYSAPVQTRSTAYIEADSNLYGKSAPAYGSTSNSS